MVIKFVSDYPNYSLLPGKYLQLVFIGNYGIPFCTCRSAWPKSKVVYYKSCIGKNFDILIEEKQ